MDLLASVDNVVLRQDTINCLIASISFHNCLKSFVKLGEDASREEWYLELVKGLLLCVSPSEGNIFCQVNQMACLSIIIANELTVIVRKA